MPEPLIESIDATSWHNWHRTSGVGGPVHSIQKPRNRWLEGPPDRDRWFEAGLAGLISIVRRAELEGRRVRAVGSGWSLSPIAYVQDYLVDTSVLSEWSLGFSASMVEAEFAGSPDQLVFAQCGVQIRTLNAHLEQSRLSLPTQGASNGQTIVGAMSTGTHGSAHEVGSIQDYVHGLHIVGEGGRHYWVERASRPVMTRAFAAWLGAELRREGDDLFNAAVVGLGSFGIIHGVVLAAEPVYALEKFVRRYDHADVMHAATTLEVAGLDLPRPTMPFHFEAAFNPYRRKKGDLGAFVRAYYKTTLGDKEPLPVVPVNDGGSIRSPDLVSVFSSLSDVAPPLVPALLQGQLNHSYPVTGVPLPRGLPGQIFDDTLPTNGGTSVEVAVPLARSREALDAIFAVTDARTFGAPVAMRYVRPSAALLSFACHAPTTCTIEMPGIDSASAAAAHESIFRAFSEAGIPATYHWGQRGPFTRASLVAGYGIDRVTRWIEARQAFLKTAEGRRMFSNEMLDGCGLSF